jgi:predicted dehydrogenase
LADAIRGETYGKLQSLCVQRLATHPGGPFYSDASACGGAALDLHVHDSDFIYSCLGMPKAVHSIGYSQVSSGCDHIQTQYLYDGYALVSAEGGWAMSDDFPFTMRYTANFYDATVAYELGSEARMTVWRRGGGSETISLSPEMGYAREIDYFVDCLKAGRRPERVTLADGLAALKIVEAELLSVKEKRVVTL